MTTHRLRRAAACYCFCTLFGLAVPSLAVNLEFGAGSPEEQFFEVTSAEVHAHIDGTTAYAGSVDGYPITDTEATGSGSFAGTGTNPDAFTEVAASIYTDIKRDSPEALFTLATPGLALPPPADHFTDGQGAHGFSTDAGVTVESSLHAFSTTGEENSDLKNLVEIITDEETSHIIDSIIHPTVVDWVIDVLPSPGETAGAPTLVVIDTVVSGILAASGSGEASASWFVTVNEDIELIAGAANDTQLLAFGEAATYDFVIPLGGSFKLRFLWELSVSATDVATAAAEFTAARIDISATILPEPSSWLILAIGLMSFQRRWLL